MTLLASLPFIMAILVVFACLQIRIRAVAKQIETDAEVNSIRFLWLKNECIPDLEAEISSLRGQTLTAFSEPMAELSNKINIIEQAMSNHDHTYKFIDNILDALEKRDRFEHRLGMHWIAIDGLTKRLVLLEQKANKKPMKTLAKAMQRKRNGKRRV